LANSYTEAKKCLEAKAATWFEMWREKQELHTGDGKLHGMQKHADLFPAVRHAISIALTLPVTTCAVERSFSTLRRVKTWFRSQWRNLGGRGKRLPPIAAFCGRQIKDKMLRNIYNISNASACYQFAKFNQDRQGSQEQVRALVT